MSGAAAAAAELIPAERVDELVREVLARGEFHPSVVDRMWTALADWIEEFLGLSASDASALVGVVVWTALGLTLGLLLIALVTFAARRRAAGARALRGSGPSAQARVEARVAELLRRAREAQAAGDLVLALRLFFFAAVVGLGEAGALEYRDAWTNRELFERGRPSPAVRERLAPLVEALDRKSFGGEAVRIEDVRGMERLGAALLAEGGA